MQASEFLEGNFQISPPVDLQKISQDEEREKDFLSRFYYHFPDNRWRIAPDEEIGDDSRLIWTISEDGSTIDFDEDHLDFYPEESDNYVELLEKIVEALKANNHTVTGSFTWEDTEGEEESIVVEEGAVIAQYNLEADQELKKECEQLAQQAIALNLITSWEWNGRDLIIQFPDGEKWFQEKLEELQLVLKSLLKAQSLLK